MDSPHCSSDFFKNIGGKQPFAAVAEEGQLEQTDIAAVRSGY